MAMAAEDSNPDLQKRYKYA